MDIDQALLLQPAEEAARGRELALERGARELALVELRQPAAQRARGDLARVPHAAAIQPSRELRQVAPVRPQRVRRGSARSGELDQVALDVLRERTRSG